jgi:GxxExxY protein
VQLLLTYPPQCNGAGTRRKSRIDTMGETTQEDRISYIVIGCAIEVHRTLGGPGLLESVYEEALAWKLEQKGLKVERQVSQPIRYKGQDLGTPFRMDMVVEGKVIVECKATTQYNKIFESQALTYLRLSGLKLALVINFGERVLKDGIHRVVNDL